MSGQSAMQRLTGLMRKAVQDYEMLAPGDRVLVGVSGGKDSVALTVGLALLRQYIGFDYQLYAVTLDPQFGGVPGEYAPLEAVMAQYNVPYQVRRTDIGPVIFEQRQEKNPCALCAKMRRGALHTAAQELGCNKVALGHHLDPPSMRRGCRWSRAAAPPTGPPPGKRPRTSSGSAAAPTTPSAKRPCTRCRRAASTAGGRCTPGGGLLSSRPIRSIRTEKVRPYGTPV